MGREVNTTRVIYCLAAMVLLVVDFSLLVLYSSIERASREQTTTPVL